MIKLTVRSIEVNVTEHCNLRCYGCDHAAPIKPADYLSVENLAKDLAALSQTVVAKEFKLSGGEPTLHPRLVEVIHVIRRSGIADKITLITNGVLLRSIDEDVWRAIDAMWVSVYPGVKQSISREELTDMARRYSVALWHKVTDRFILKFLHRENCDRALVGRVFECCELRRDCHTLHRGRYFKCTPAPYLRAWLVATGRGSAPLPIGGIPVGDDERFRDELAAYLESNVPLDACRYLYD